MKRSIIKWACLVAVFALLTLGGLSLMLTPEYDPQHAADTWGGLGLSALFFGLGVWLVYKFDKHNLLPE